MVKFDKYSYAAANIFPLKVFLHKKVISSIEEGFIPPIHVQLNPTNRCNFNCSFCSCSARNRDFQLSYDQVMQITKTVGEQGCEAMTITGGGEPTLHPDFDAIINLLGFYEIEIGLVTNGTNLHTLNRLNEITWIRVSASDQMVLQLTRAGLSYPDWIRQLSVTIDEHPDVDWAISYVLSDQPNIQLLLDLIQFANDHKMTHIRIVNDILQVDAAESQMESIWLEVQKQGFDDNLVNYQDRSNYTRGVNPCLISILKPVIGADGGVYPCCGTQYALVNPSRDYETRMRMGFIHNLSTIIIQQQFYDGSKCVKCYYNPYNEALSIMRKGIAHEAFV